MEKQDKNKGANNSDDGARDLNDDVAPNSESATGADRPPRLRHGSVGS